MKATEYYELFYTKPVNIASDKKMNFIWSNSGGKVITRARVHCVLQTSGYKYKFCKYSAGYPKLSSQSEHLNVDIHWFGIYTLLRLFKAR